ncbi:GntR family transcriptional regulator [Streptomyces sp. NPDC021019]|uniref:GntR family transcriptional regulator n=1 Tax=Streptomyces sp. NPDC021019 TaxID=3365108 RepID=UPI0037A0BB3B
MIEFAPDLPRWRQVADIIRQRIEDGTYPPRTRVPSVLQLQAEFGIAAATGQKVHRALRDEGLIYTEPGLGSFVTRTDARPGA